MAVVLVVLWSYDAASTASATPVRLLHHDSRRRPLRCAPPQDSARPLPPHRPLLPHPRPPTPTQGHCDGACPQPAPLRSPPRPRRRAIQPGAQCARVNGQHHHTET
ncbi:hypothetical protein B0J12DRAFT_688600 [Macrophomina phaseolina]|uniref:Secreted protein n=1 Tax=Macrophomina phaseolina TaxID=35725 RepID=A0ABQ8FUH0_9PEZI|nr:hypothetical protein B0J12DRAFT_688600 [Macrophomina phaseolina]